MKTLAQRLAKKYLLLYVMYFPSIQVDVKIKCQYTESMQSNVLQTVSIKYWLLHYCCINLKLVNSFLYTMV